MGYQVTLTIWCFCNYLYMVIGNPSTSITCNDKMFSICPSAIISIKMKAIKGSISALILCYSMSCCVKTDQVVLCILVHSHGPPHDISKFCAWYGEWSAVTMIMNKKLRIFFCNSSLFFLFFFLFFLYLAFWLILHILRPHNGQPLTPIHGLPVITCNPNLYFYTPWI